AQAGQRLFPTPPAPPLGPPQGGANASGSQPNLRIPSPDSQTNARSASAPSQSVNAQEARQPFIPPTLPELPQLSQLPHFQSNSFTSSFSPAPGVVTNTRIMSRMWSSVPVGGIPQGTAAPGQQYYLLMGPDGPSAVLLGPQPYNLPPLNQQFPL